MLTRSITILEHTHTDQDTGRHHYAVPPNHDENTNLYPTLTIDPGRWKDMGKPDTVTITIQPGDHLNNDDDDGPDCE